MSLVAYPDSDSDGDGDGTGADKNKGEASAAQASIAHLRPAAKRKRTVSAQNTTAELPPLPVAFHDLYSTNARLSTSDDPSLHGGRKRTVPHIEGNWPSHVYLEWLPSQTESQSLHKLIDSVREAIEHANRSRKKQLPVPDITPSLESALGTPLPLHVSLSRTLQIKTEGRDDFLATLKACLRRAAVRPFNVRFASLKWVPNFERNRWFLVLGIERPANDELNRLLNACNEAAENGGYPRLYIGGKGDGPMEEDTSAGQQKKRRRSKHDEGEKNKANSEPVDRTENFHISIAWNLVEPDSEWISLVRDIDVGKHIRSPNTPFDVVKVKIGNTINNVELNAKNSLGKGGILG